MLRKAQEALHETIYNYIRAAIIEYDAITYHGQSANIDELVRKARSGILDSLGIYRAVLRKERDDPKATVEDKVKRIVSHTGPLLSGSILIGPELMQDLCRETDRILDSGYPVPAALTEIMGKLEDIDWKTEENKLPA